MVMNKGLQICTLTKMILKQYKGSPIDPDDAIELMKECLDNQIYLNQNNSFLVN